MSVVPPQADPLSVKGKQKTRESNFEFRIANFEFEKAWIVHRRVRTKESGVRIQGAANLLSVVRCQWSVAKEVGVGSRGLEAGESNGILE